MDPIGLEMPPPTPLFSFMIDVVKSEFEIIILSGADNNIENTFKINYLG
jgi:hypothetical protein